MKRIGILDTETTGLNPDEDQVIQVAWLDLQTLEIKNHYFRPTVPIKFGAMAVHHITENDLKYKPLVGGDEYQAVINELNQYDYFIGHNPDFDIQMLGLDTKSIDTLAMARKLIETDSYTQTALMYKLFGDKAFELVLNAHRADTDIQNNLKLFKRLLKLGNLQNHSPSTLFEYSEMAKIPTVFTFGKYKDKTYKFVAENDPQYFSWWIEKSETKPDQYQMMAITLAFQSL